MQETSNIVVPPSQIHMICPSGQKVFIGKFVVPGGRWHKNPLLNALRGTFERWRFERNRVAWNKQYPVSKDIT